MTFVGGRAERGVRGGAWRFDGQSVATARSPQTADFGYFDKFSVSLWARADDIAQGVLVSRTSDQPREAGWYVQLADGRVQFNLVKRWLDDSIRIETVDPLTAGQWHHITATYDGSRRTRGMKIYIDGRPAEVRVNLDYINQSFQVEAPFRIGGGGGPRGAFRGTLDEVAIYTRVLRPSEAAALAASETVSALARLPADRRTATHRAKLGLAYLSRFGNPAHRQAHADWLKARDAVARHRESIPSVMVMEELPTPRDAFVLVRGQYDRPGEKVSRGTPAGLPPMPDEAPRNRLGLAQWLVAPEHPLTARVAVNRAWQMLFGAGLVATVEDFGVQGQRPSHPRLLDYLATELIRQQWRLKDIQRQIVTSATYRQQSQVRGELNKLDPANRYLARGPRVRLSAGVIRDQALAVSGLLSRRLGGPSAKPYQPADLWKDIATVTNYEQDRGEGLYRRSLYTYWKRTVAPPSMVALDASPRETCTVRQTRTNTPLQALALMNETGFVEASRALAQRVGAERTSPQQRVEWLFRLAVGRRPRPAEAAILLRAYERHRRHFATHPEEARQVLQSSGELPVDDRLPADQLAAPHAGRQHHAEPGRGDYQAMRLDEEIRDVAAVARRRRIRRWRRRTTLCRA